MCGRGPYSRGSGGLRPELSFPAVYGRESLWSTSHSKGKNQPEVSRQLQEKFPTPCQEIGTENFPILLYLLLHLHLLFFLSQSHRADQSVVYGKQRPHACDHKSALPAARTLPIDSVSVRNTGSRWALFFESRRACIPGTHSRQDGCLFWDTSELSHDHQPRLLWPGSHGQWDHYDAHWSI